MNSCHIKVEVATHKHGLILVVDVWFSRSESVANLYVSLEIYARELI